MTKPNIRMSPIDVARHWAANPKELSRIVEPVPRLLDNAGLPRMSRRLAQQVQGVRVANMKRLGGLFSAWATALHEGDNWTASVLERVAQSEWRYEGSVPPSWDVEQRMLRAVAYGGMSS